MKGGGDDEAKEVHLRPRVRDHLRVGREKAGVPRVRLRTFTEIPPDK